LAAFFIKSSEILGRRKTPRNIGRRKDLRDVLMMEDLPRALVPTDWSKFGAPSASNKTTGCGVHNLRCHIRSASSLITKSGSQRRTHTDNPAAAVAATATGRTLAAGNSPQRTRS
jgi:hypothetical protein